MNTEETESQGEVTDKTEKKQELRTWLFKKGQSGNPKGRPKGTFSLKTYAKHMLAEMTDKQRQDFLNGIDKRIVWEMAEGRAKQDMELSGEVKAKLISVDE